MGKDSDFWLIEFADSVLFPEGGGQPTDYGTLLPLRGHHPSIPIHNVQREGLRCLLHSPHPLSPGDQVRQEVDFTRRWGHMQQHTGQHLLSAVMDTYHDLATIGWGMGQEGDMNYVDVPRKPSLEEMCDIQSRCNQLIRENLPITIKTPENAQGNKLPDDYDKSLGVVRVISIGDLDHNTCCGTHLCQTSHISLILIHPNTQTVHSKNCRIFFTAGDRAVQLSSSSVNALSSISRLMSCASVPNEILTNIKRLCDVTAELKKKEVKLLLDLANYEGNRARTLLRSGKNAWVYHADGSFDFINRVVSIVSDIAKKPGGVVIIAAGEVKKAGPVVIYGDKEAVEATVTKVKEIIKEIKGGGKGERWQGKVPEWRHDEMEALKQLVSV
ncbi:Threonyl/alanyl tRNA synthetase [Apiospora marii]|uniref:Threonyl/alanyl tRNA synthetase n=1 Tax=Apiospora marii TaxID=335849 RepID=A0ABR1R3I5_9PEZI